MKADQGLDDAHARMVMGATGHLDDVVLIGEPHVVAAGLAAFRTAVAQRGYAILGSGVGQRVRWFVRQSAGGDISRFPPDFGGLPIGKYGPGGQYLPQVRARARAGF
jgi:hypothetical protein